MKKERSFGLYQVKNKMMYRCNRCLNMMAAFEGVVGAKMNGIRIWLHRKCLEKMQRENENIMKGM